MSSLLSSPDIMAQIVGLCLVLLLPVLPAILIFLVIPGSRAEGQGPFQGLKVKVGGGFGAYLITALLAFWVFRFITSNSLKEVVGLKVDNKTLNEQVTDLKERLNTLNEQLKGGALEVWTVSGPIELADNQPPVPLSRIRISVRPSPTIKSGHYRFGVLMPKHTPGATEYPSIAFEMAGYGEDEISLDPAVRIIDGVTQVTENAAARHFTLRPVRLLKEGKPYSPSVTSSAEVPKSALRKD